MTSVRAVPDKHFALEHDNSPTFPSGRSPQSGKLKFCETDNCFVSNDVRTDSIHPSSKYPLNIGNKTSHKRTPVEKQESMVWFIRKTKSSFDVETDNTKVIQREPGRRPSEGRSRVSLNKSIHCMLSGWLFHCEPLFSQPPPRNQERF